MSEAIKRGGLARRSADKAYQIAVIASLPDISDLDLPRMVALVKAAKHDTARRGRLTHYLDYFSLNADLVRHSTPRILPKINPQTTSAQKIVPFIRDAAHEVVRSGLFYRVTANSHLTHLITLSPESVEAVESYEPFREARRETYGSVDHTPYRKMQGAMFAALACHAAGVSAPDPNIPNLQYVT